MSLSRCFRAIGEQDPGLLVKAFVRSSKQAMTASESFWHEGSNASWQSLQEDSADEYLVKAEVALRGLALRISYLSESCNGLSWAHTRVATGMIQALGVSEGNTFVKDLGQLQRYCYAQHIIHRAEPADPSSGDLAVGDASSAAIIGTSRSTTSPITASSNAETGTKEIKEKKQETESKTKFLATRMHAQITKLLRGMHSLISI